MAFDIVCDSGGGAVHKTMKRTVLLFLIALPSLYASEHRGIVRYNELPLPGATIPAARGDTKTAAVSDLQGFYRLPDLADGLWTIRVEMLGFEPIRREITVGHPVSHFNNLGIGTKA